MESDRSLQQKAQGTTVTGGGSGRSKLSLKRKKDKDPPAQQHSSPPRNPNNFSLKLTPVDILTVITPKASKTTSITNNRENDRDLDAHIHDKTAPMEKLKHDGANSDAEFVPLDGEREKKREDERIDVEPFTPHPTAHSDVDDDGLGKFYFCHICQKDLTRFNESRRQTHINRCCDKQEEEKKSLAKEGQSSAFSCLLCEKSFKSDNVRMTHMKSCAKSEGVAPDRLVHLMRESKKTSPAIMDSTASSGVQESGFSSRLEGERAAPLPTRRSKRLTSQRGEGEKKGKGSEVITVATREDDDFAMPPPVSCPTGRRGRKRKRDNLQDNYLEELEEDQVRLAVALSASMESGGSAALMYGRETSDADQGKGRKRQKRKNTTAAEVVPPLLTVTTEEAKNIIGQRAEEILRCSETVDNNGALEEDDSDIPCTPAFQESELGRGEGGGGYRPAPSVKPGTTEGGHDGKDNNELLLLEEKDEEELELDDDTAVKSGNACLADGDSSPKSTDEGLSNEGKETGPVQAESDTKSREKSEDDEAMSLGDESEHSKSGDTPLVAKTDATEHGISFHEDLQDVDYPTLWQLTSEETENNEHFYVPALVPVVSPVKAEQTRCKVCEVEPCLALTLQAVPTIPTESQYWEGKLNISPIQQTADSSWVNCDNPAINQLLSDLRGLVGSSLFSDVQILTGSGSIIPAHAVILAARCPKIREILEQSQTSPVSLDFSEFDDDSILAFLCYIYTGSSPTESDDNAELWYKNFSLLLERWCSDKGDGERSEAKHTEIKNSEDMHHMDFSCHTKELSPARMVGDSSHHVSKSGLTSEGGSPELERDCSLRRRDETVWRCSSSERSHPNSHISLSSMDSNDVVICKTPTILLSPGERRELLSPGERRENSSDYLFHASPSHCVENDYIHEYEREGEAVEGDVVKEQSERTVESIVVESSNSSSRDSSVLSLASPKSSHKQGEVHTFSDNSLPDVSIPNVSTPEISIPKVSIPDASNPIPEYSPVDDYSFGVFDEDFVSNPSSSFDHEPVEPASLQLITPVMINDRTVTVVPESINTVKRKPQCFKTPANNCGVELQTDDDITPVPDFKSMRTPCLKGECARFGVKALPKKKMIAKLSEIYEYTHPLVDEEGRIVSVESESLEDGNNTKTTKQRPADKTKTKSGRTKKAGAAEGGGQRTAAAQACNVNELKVTVLEYFKSDKQLYQDILLFKPMELSYFCTKVKSAGISVAKEKLADILDNLCITYTVPRQQRTGKKTVSR